MKNVSVFFCRSKELVAISIICYLCFAGKNKRCLEVSEVMTLQMEIIGHLENTVEYLRAITTHSYILRVLGLLVAKLNTLPPMLRIEK